MPPTFAFNDSPGFRLLLVAASIVEAAGGVAGAHHARHPLWALRLPDHAVAQQPRRRPPPRELSIHIVEIDPSAPGISFLGTPGNGAVAEEYTRQTTSSFVNSQGLAVGMNGDFYTTNTGANASVNGLGMSNGSIVSAAANGWASFIVRQDNTPRFARTARSNQRPHAVSEISISWRDGVNIAPNTLHDTLNPHTRSRRHSSQGHICFMTVDGRKLIFTKQRTMTWPTCERFASRRDQLDGGGSSTMVSPTGGRRRSQSTVPATAHPAKNRGANAAMANHFGVAHSHPEYKQLPRPPPQEADSRSVMLHHPPRHLQWRRGDSIIPSPPAAPTASRPSPRLLHRRRASGDGASTHFPGAIATARPAFAIFGRGSREQPC